MNPDFKKSALKYSNAYLNAYNEVLDKYYADKINVLLELGGKTPATIYQKEIDKDISIAVFQADKDFFLFFIPKKENIYLDVRGREKFSEEWSAAISSQNKF